MAKQNFGQLVGKKIQETEGRMLTVFRQSAQVVIEEAQEPRGSGGNMPGRTSFLRNSGQARLNDFPVGESERPDNYTPQNWTPDDALLVINRAKIGDKIIFGWTARYAIYMERRYGFLRLAAQQWPQIVRRNARALRQRISR